MESKTGGCGSRATHFPALPDFFFSKEKLMLLAFHTSFKCFFFSLSTADFCVISRKLSMMLFLQIYDAVGTNIWHGWNMLLGLSRPFHIKKLWPICIPCYKVKLFLTEKSQRSILVRGLVHDKTETSLFVSFFWWKQALKVKT